MSKKTAANTLIPLAGVALGLFVFVIMVTIDYLGGMDNSVRIFSQHPFLSPIYNSLAFFGYHDSMSEDGFWFFCLAVVSFIALRSGKGIGTSLAEGFLLFAAPILVAFEFGVYCFIPWFMDTHVTNFALWTWGSSYLITNEVVLFVAALMFILGLDWLILRAKWITNPYRLVFLVESCAGLLLLAVALANFQTPPPPSHVVFFFSTRR